MDYQRIYNQLIERARSENRSKGEEIYYEAHHIVPKCLGGEGRVDQWRTHPNIVLLTATEHFYAHYYLMILNPGNSKLLYAFWAMCNQSNPKAKRDYFNLEEFALLYDEARTRLAEEGPSEEHRAKISATMKGIVRGPNSEEHKAKISAAKRGKPRCEKWKSSMKGKPLSKEHRAKISATMKGVPKSEDARAKTSAAMKGRTFSEEHKAKLREAKRLRKEGKFLNKP